MDNLFSEGLTLMVFGMGFVFVFLTLLVIFTSVMSRLLGRYLPEPAARPRPQAAVTGVQSDSNNDELIAVLTAAVHKYRSR